MTAFGSTIGRYFGTEDFILACWPRTVDNTVFPTVGQISQEDNTAYTSNNFVDTVSYTTKKGKLSIAKLVALVTSSKVETGVLLSDEPWHSGLDA